MKDDDEYKIFCPFCGSRELDTQIHSIDDLHYKIHFRCETCEMIWNGPKEQEKRYIDGKKPDDRIIKYWIKKKLTQDYVDQAAHDDR